MRVQKSCPTHIPHPNTPSLPPSLTTSKDAVFVGGEEGRHWFPLHWFLTMQGECCIFSWEEHLPVDARGLFHLWVHSSVVAETFPFMPAKKRKKKEGQPCLIWSDFQARGRSERCSWARRNNSGLSIQLHVRRGKVSINGEGTRVSQRLDRIKSGRLKGKA